MDIHFAEAATQDNLPILLALLRVWNRNFLGFPAHGIMPYDQRLQRLPAWAQQLEMESNGKRVDRAGKPLDHASAPLIWGEAGTNAQHSFFQYLHQGTDIVPIDILLPRSVIGIPDQPYWQHSHRVLSMNALAQAEALALGSENAEQPYRHFPGNRPSVMMSWQQSNPYAIGRLLALYEHITVSCGFLWGLNSFDQWGVELGKTMALKLLSDDNRDQFSHGAQAFLLHWEAE
jgi:glucose-6-phosphate isomerase